jgi:hypothetical protein
MQQERIMVTKCYECGGEVKMVARSGRLRPYRRGLEVLVPASLAIPTCQQCGGEYLDGAMSDAIDAAAREQGLARPVAALAGE